MDSVTGPARSLATPIFSLLANPFAVLDAAPDATLADLAAAADRIGTPEAAAAARTLSVPRSRLAAELAFLPGVDGRQVAAILAALRKNTRPDVAAGLPDTAAANLFAHLCAAGLAGGADHAALARHHPENPDALVGVLDAARLAAGMPRVQPAALAEERMALADRHAAALVDSLLSAGGNAAAALSALIAGPSDGAATLLRKTAATWTRRTASDLAKLEGATATAVAAAVRTPALTPLATAAIGIWAAYSRPQRLVDARAALDHRPTLAAIRPWRAAAAQIAEKSLSDGVALAEALAAACGADLPGEGTALRAEVQGLRAHAEYDALAPLLTALDALTKRLAAAPKPFCATLAKHRFGPDLPRGDAAELWQGFDAACAASTLSARPWIAVRTLVLALVGGDNSLPTARAALSLQRGIAARAEAAGQSDLAAQVTAGIRPLEGGVAMAAYRRVIRKRWMFWWAVPWRNRRIFRAIDRALALVDDPDNRAALLRHQASLRRGIRRRRIVWAGLALLGGAIVGINALDSDYAKHAPYRHLPPQALARP